MTFNGIIQWVSFFFFFVAAVMHVGFFIIESFLYQKPDGYKFFKISPQDHQATKTWAFNQGFYNLFLALGTFWGLYFVTQKQVMVAGVLTGFCGMSMLAAGVVLWLSAPHLRKAAYYQIIPPLLGFISLSFHILHFF